MSFELKKDNSFVRKMAREPEPKRCPFCGGEAVIDGFPLRYMKCKECGAETETFSSEEEVVEAWNRRVNDETINGRP